MQGESVKRVLEHFGTANVDIPHSPRYNIHLHVVITLFPIINHTQK